MTEELRRALEKLMVSSRKARLAGALPPAEEEDEEEDETLTGSPRAAETAAAPPSPVLPVAESPERPRPGP